MVRGARTTLTSWLDRLGEHSPFRPSTWRSPLRGPWLTAVWSITLLVGVTTLFVTGLLSYAAYDPHLGGAANDPTPHKGLLGSYLFTWPTHPAWLYQATQGVHVLLGLALVPVLLAKLWSVLPRLFVWPPATSPAHAVERLSLLLLVGGALFEFATGILDVQLTYVFPVGFYQAHFYGAWVFVAALAVHAALRMRRVLGALRGRSLRDELTTPASATLPEPPDDHGLVSPDPQPATVSRRGALGVVGASSLALVALSLGQSVGGALRAFALLAPRGRTGGGDFPVNKTAAYRRITADLVGDDWRLELRTADRVQRLSRAELLALPQRSFELPIACVEGWSTVQTWTGVRLLDLAALVDADLSRLDYLQVRSLQRGGAFGTARLAPNQVRSRHSLLALRVGDADLSLDHGYPARIVVPAAPGVHQTKWVSSLEIVSR